MYKILVPTAESQRFPCMWYHHQHIFQLFSLSTSSLNLVTTIDCDILLKSANTKKTIAKGIRDKFFFLLQLSRGMETLEESDSCDCSLYEPSLPTGKKRPKNVSFLILVNLIFDSGDMQWQEGAQLLSTIYIRVNCWAFSIPRIIAKIAVIRRFLKNNLREFFLFLSSLFSYFT